MKRLLHVTGVGFIFAMMASITSAHYLWVTIAPKGGNHGTVNIYFEGGPGPGDGQHLDPFINRGTTWIRTIAAPKTTILEVKETTSPGKRWLAAKLPAAAPCVIDSFAMWGVYTYGKTEVLLHYYAKNAQVASAAELSKIGRSDKLAFDVVPTLDGRTVTCEVTWNGKPAPNCKVNVRGPKGFKPTKGMKTDAHGKITFTAENKGRYTVHAILDQPGKSGTQDGKKYDVKRHHSTLVMTLPLAASTK